jgi:methylenetetrahydrofolate reductase (NADPH)
MQENPAMHIRQRFAPGRHVFSFEFFPPKSDAGAANLERTIAELSDLSPAYVSVTYGAGGSTRERTIDLVSRIQRAAGITTMAHLTCVGASRADLAGVVDRLIENGVVNVLPLRGDPPAGETSFTPPPDGFAHASELVAFLRDRYGDRLCLAGACYPEGHLECRDLDRDLANLRTKVAAGVDFLVTQLFFDNRRYFDFVSRARRAGITVPIVPGIMPILNVAQIERFTKLCGASLPEPLFRELDRRREDAAAVVQIGIAHATAQCVELLQGGAPGIHFYTLNQSPATRVILTALRAAHLV